MSDITGIEEIWELQEREGRIETIRGQVEWLNEDGLRGLIALQAEAYQRLKDHDEAMCRLLEEARQHR